MSDPNSNPNNQPPPGPPPQTPAPSRHQIPPHAPARPSPPQALFTNYMTPTQLPSQRTFIPPTSSVPFDPVNTDDIPDDIPLCTITPSQHTQQATTNTFIPNTLNTIPESHTESSQDQLPEHKFENNSNVPNSSGPHTNSSEISEVRKLQRQYDQQTIIMQQKLEQMEKALNQQYERAAQLEYQQSYHINQGHPQYDNSNYHDNSIAKLISKPDTFAGESKDIDTWIFSMRNYLFLSNVHPSAHVQTAGTYLRGNAMQWFTFLQPMERQVMLTNFDTFAAALLNYFRPLDIQADARQRLNKITQTGSIAAFNNLFLSITQKLPLMDPQEKIDVYRGKLKYEIQMQIATTEFKNLTEMMKATIRIESLLQRNTPTSNSTYKQRYPFPPRTTQQSHQPNSTAVKVNNIQMEEKYETDQFETDTPTQMNLNAMRAPIPKMTDAIKEECKRLKLCFRCRQSGHGSRNCTYFSKSNQPFRPSQNISQSAPTRNF